MKFLARWRVARQQKRRERRLEAAVERLLYRQVIKELTKTGAVMDR